MIEIVQPNAEYAKAFTQFNFKGYTTFKSITKRHKHNYSNTFISMVKHTVPPLPIT